MTTDTKFIAFYSYKGGVGRSLALANLACLLAREGRKVLILDLDLEAPGQHQTSLFRDSYLPRTPIRGVLDLLTDYREHQAIHLAEKDAPGFEWELSSFIRRSTLFDSGGDLSGSTEKSAPSGSIWLLAAGGGRVDAGYQIALVD